MFKDEDQGKIKFPWMSGWMLEVHASASVLERELAKVFHTEKKYGAGIE